jgi:hypothetical protein
MNDVLLHTQRHVLYVARVTAQTVDFDFGIDESAVFSAEPKRHKLSSIQEESEPLSSSPPISGAAVRRRSVAAAAALDGSAQHHRSKDALDHKHSDATASSTSTLASDEQPSDSAPRRFASLASTSTAAAATAGSAEEEDPLAAATTRSEPLPPAHASLNAPDIESSLSAAVGHGGPFARSGHVAAQRRVDPQHEEHDLLD